MRRSACCRTASSCRNGGHAGSPASTAPRSAACRRAAAATTRCGGSYTPARVATPAGGYRRAWATGTAKRGGRRTRVGEPGCRRRTGHLEQSTSNLASYAIWLTARRGNESAYLIVARVKSADSVVHEEATGTLVSVEPLDAEASSSSMKAVYEARGAFPSGLLQWSPLYGSNERARITPAGLDLNIFVFLETDDRGRAAYLDGSVHQRQDMIILDGYKWRVTIEVAADGAHAQSTGSSPGAGRRRGTSVAIMDPSSRPTRCATGAGSPAPPAATSSPVRRGKTHSSSRSTAGCATSSWPSSSSAACSRRRC